MDIFSVDLKFCHVRFHTLQPCPSWPSNQSSAFNSTLHTFLHPALVTFPLYMTIPSHPTTSNDSCDRLNSKQPSVVVVFLPRPMEGMGRLQFPDIFSQNCHFHHRRLESLEHLMCLIYILLSTTVSHFLDLTDAIFLQGLLLFFFFFCIHFHFASTLCMCVMYLTSI